MFSTIINFPFFYGYAENIASWTYNTCWWSNLHHFVLKTFWPHEGHLNYLTNYKSMSLMTEGKAILSNWFKLLSFGYLSLANNKIKMAVDTLKKSPNFIHSKKIWWTDELWRLYAIFMTDTKTKLGLNFGKPSKT